MKFVFLEKSDLETDIITNVLYTEKIPYKIKSKEIRACFFDEEEDYCECHVHTVYDIFVDTDLEHFDYIKYISEKKIQERVDLEICYMRKARRNNVSRIHKKDIANTNSRNKS